MRAISRGRHATSARGGGRGVGTPSAASLVAARCVDIAPPTADRTAWEGFRVYFYRAIMPSGDARRTSRARAHASIAPIACAFATLAIGARTVRGEDIPTAFDDALKTAVNACLTADSSDATGTNCATHCTVGSPCGTAPHTFTGAIGTWNVAPATSMKELFMGKTDFNADISGWDVSNVKDFTCMFAKSCPAGTALTDWPVIAAGSGMKFNQNIGSWDVSGAGLYNINESGGGYGGSSGGFVGMFYGCEDFNQDISLWNVHRTTKYDMQMRLDYMFAGARAFNQDISSWNVANIQDMVGMFANAVAFNKDISAWDDCIAQYNTWTGYSQVHGHSDMFSGATAFQAAFTCADADDGPASTCAGSAARATPNCQYFDGVATLPYTLTDLPAEETISALPANDNVPVYAFDGLSFKAKCFMATVQRTAASDADTYFTLKVDYTAFSKTNSGYRRNELTSFTFASQGPFPAQYYGNTPMCGQMEASSSQVCGETDPVTAVFDSTTATEQEFTVIAECRTKVMGSGWPTTCDVDVDVVEFTCGSPPSIGGSSSSDLPKGAIAGVAIACILTTAVVLLVLYCKRRKQDELREQLGMAKPGQPQIIVVQQ